MAAIKSVLTVKTPSRPAQAAFSLRLRWEARRLWRRLGWPCAIGVAGLALSALALLQAEAQQERQLALRAQLATAARVAAAPVQKAPDDSDSLAAFHAYLPDHDTIPEQLQELLAVAQRSDVTLDKADYKPQADGNAPFLRYQITLPVKAEYAQLQSFIVNALQALPTLTLDSVTFKREQIEAGEIEARIQFILLVKNPGRPA